jgi:hypothetical protein
MGKDVKGSERGLIWESIWEDLWTAKKWLNQDIGKISARYQWSYPTPRPSLEPSIRNKTRLSISLTQQDRQCTYKFGIEGRERNHCWSAEEVLHILSVCLQPWLSLVRQCARAALNCHLWPVPLYHFFSNYLINGTIFEEVLLHIKYVFWFSLQLLSETFLILRRFERDIIINVHTSSF